MSKADKQPTVIYNGRKDGAPSSAVQVKAGGTSRRLALGEKVEVPRSIADRCEELRDTFDFTISAATGNGDGNGNG